MSKAACGDLASSVKCLRVLRPLQDNWNTRHCLDF